MTLGNYYSRLPGGHREPGRYLYNDFLNLRYVARGSSRARAILKPPTRGPVMTPGSYWSSSASVRASYISSELASTSS